MKKKNSHSKNVNSGIQNTVIFRDFKIENSNEKKLLLTRDQRKQMYALALYAYAMKKYVFCYHAAVIYKQLKCIDFKFLFHTVTDHISLQDKPT